MQIFLQGKLLGVREFLLAPTTDDASEEFTGRAQWVTLLSEVLPRAVLEELGLSKLLLGSSGGGQFLIVMPADQRASADKLLRSVALDINEMSAGAVRLIWAATEHLGDWSDIRKRLSVDLERMQGAPAAEGFSSRAPSVPEGNYFQELGRTLRRAASVGWSPDSPARIQADSGRRVWVLGVSADAIPLARHAALDDQNSDIAAPDALGSRSDGHGSWGVLLADVDQFAIRLRKAATIEEHIQISLMIKQFFVGEIEVLCSMPEYWKKVSVIFTGGDGFALYGAWDTLLAIAREMERLFRKFAENNLKQYDGPEGKTLSMALALAATPDASLGAVFEAAEANLEAAKSERKDCLWLLGRTLEWKQFEEAYDLKELLLRMIRDFGCSPQYLHDLTGLYRETQGRVSRRQAIRSGGDRPWRYHRRIRRILSAARPGAARPSTRGEYAKARAALIANLIGRSAVSVKLRPAGRVALEWARLSAERGVS